MTGFYGRDLHVSLRREGRLVASVNFLDELPPKVRKNMVLMEKIGSGTTVEDAEELAKVRGSRGARQASRTS
jgi:hypothetical protein